MKLLKFISLVFLSFLFDNSFGQIIIENKGQDSLWIELSGDWEMNSQYILPGLKKDKSTSHYVLSRRDMQSDSKWNSLNVEFRIEDNSIPNLFGFALNTQNKNDFGILRIIRKSLNQFFLQAGFWKNNVFRPSMNVELKEQMIPGRWYQMKIFPTENRNEYRDWTIVLMEKENGKIIIEKGIQNKMPLFGRGVPGLYTNGGHVTFQNFYVEKITSPSQESHLKLAPLFQSGMVLQRDRNVPVWGKSEPGEIVTIKIKNQKKKARSDNSGKWRIDLDPVKATDSCVMQVISGLDTILLKNIAFGEVWLASGQSNMNMKVWQSDVAGVAQSMPEDRGLRFFIQPRWPSEIPLFTNGGYWEHATPTNSEEWSAVAYSFALQIREKLKVPVGVIWSCWGGTTAECWLPREALKTDPLTKPIMDQYTKAKKALEKGEEPTGIHPYNVPGQHKSPGALFNGMIYPHIPYAMKGVIWYQGEANTGRAKQYESLFPMLIESWRRLWNNADLYFAYVQLAGYNGGQSGSDVESAWPALREAQRITLQKLNNVGMAVTIDLGHETNIHPRQKIEVGKRLARWALHDVYGFNELVRSGPLYESVDFSGDHALVSFSEIAAGLISRDGEELKGFTIAGQDQKFFPAKARVVSDGKQIKVWAEEVTQPVAVRYAWENYPAEANLLNSASLPASPFRTDKWFLPTDKNR